MRKYCENYVRHKKHARETNGIDKKFRGSLAEPKNFREIFEFFNKKWFLTIYKISGKFFIKSC